MGGDDYNDSVPDRSDSSVLFSSDASGRSYSRASEVAMSRRQEPAYDVFVKNRIIVVEADEEIVFIFVDFSGSMGGDALIIRDKMSMVWAQLKKYLKKPAICVGGVGDADTDFYPLQINNKIVAGEIVTGDEIKDELEKLYIEGGGGGQGMESYELAAYYLLHNVEIMGDKKPYAIFIGDEGFYDTVSASQIRKHIGGEARDADAFEVFRRLSEKFHVCLIHRRYNNSRRDPDIIEQWKKALGAENVIILQTAMAVADDLLGFIALHSKRSIDEYVADMIARGQTPERWKEVRGALGPLSDSLAMVPIDAVIAKADGGAQRSRPGKRL